MFGHQIATRLRDARKRLGLRQQHVASAIDLSVSAVSRLERGIRGLRVEQLLAWAGALGYRVEVVLFEPATAKEAWSEGDEPTMLSDEELSVLAEVAAVLPHIPLPARQALAYEMQLWRDEARRSDTPK